MTTIGFVGPGTMGAPMISNLCKAGHRVLALGRSDTSRARIDAAGGEQASGIQQLADVAEVVITMLPETNDVIRVMEADGLLRRMRPGQTYIDMSTIAPDVSRRLWVACNAVSVDCLDAPVSGGEAAAKEGTLSIMVGGDRPVYERMLPILLAMARSATYIGAAGSGQITKAVNQLIVASNIEAVAEGLVLLEAAEVDLDAAYDAISGGLAGSTVMDRKRDAFLGGDFRPGFRIALHNKDLRILMNEAQRLRRAVPLAALVSQTVAAAERRGHGNLDHSALLKLAREVNGEV